MYEPISRKYSARECRRARGQQPVSEEDASYKVGVKYNSARSSIRDIRVFITANRERGEIMNEEHMREQTNDNDWNAIHGIARRSKASNHGSNT